MVWLLRTINLTVDCSWLQDHVHFWTIDKINILHRREVQVVFRICQGLLIAESVSKDSCGLTAVDNQSSSWLLFVESMSKDSFGLTAPDDQSKDRLMIVDCCPNHWKSDQIAPASDPSWLPDLQRIVDCWVREAKTLVVWLPQEFNVTVDCSWLQVYVHFWTIGKINILHKREIWVVFRICQGLLIVVSVSKHSCGLTAADNQSCSWLLLVESKSNDSCGLTALDD